MYEEFCDKKTMTDLSTKKKGTFLTEHFTLQRACMHL